MTPLVPDYGRSTLADLLPSIGAHVGVIGSDDVLGLPRAQRWVVLLVDGLGEHLLWRSRRHAPYLSGLLGSAPTITCGVPSTTATSLTSLGTGLAPGAHGMPGYSFRDPASGGVVNALLWDTDLDPIAFQPKATYFERMSAAGVSVASVIPERFDGSGLTRAGLRGTTVHGVADEHDEDARVRHSVAAATAAECALVYTYERALDHAGHGEGTNSAAWLRELRRIDDLAARLRDELPSDVRLVVTGDHGMVDVAQERQIITEDHADLMAGLDALAGEGRMRQLYAAPEEVEPVRRRWAEHLGERAWVLTRGEAIAAGWFGPMDPGVVDRFGDVLVAMRDDWAVMTRSQPRELSLVGMHGSLTPAEMTVPLLVD